MGTSSSNGGPKGPTDLLPPWYDGGDMPPDAPPHAPEAPDGMLPPPDGIPETDPATGNPEKTIPSLKTGDWSKAKNAITRYANNTSGSGVGKAAKQYVRTLGGSGRAKRAAASGIRAGGLLAGILWGIAAGGSGGGGLDKTLTELGLASCIGKTSEETLARLADAIAPEGATNDEAVVRDAMLETINSLYERVLDGGGDLTTLEEMTPDMIKEAVMEFTANYIYTKWLYELGLAVERNAVSEKDAVTLEKEIREFVHAEVRETMKGKEIKDFSPDTKANREIIDKIFEMAYSTLEK